MQNIRKLLLAALLALATMPSPAADTVTAMEEYLDFVDYGGGIILPEQIPAADWKKIVVIDARDAGQYQKDHIPGALNIEWRQVLARRTELPQDKMVLLYCNTGTLSAQAGFALRLAGMDNVRILQNGFTGWKAKGGFDAHRRVTEAKE
ncbi:MAG: rhodanese-like domain-containing protein [Sulfuricella sp.]|nr:rhodanese-like domain-containing protein [Sulfuricella sp.]